MAAEKALQIAVKRRDGKSKGEKERYTHLNAEFQRIARRDKKIWKILENSAGATGLEKSVFMAIPKKGKKERYTQMNVKFQRIARREKKA